MPSLEILTRLIVDDGVPADALVQRDWNDFNQNTATDDDPVPENNQARFLVGVQGPRPLLHVTTSASSGLAQLLRAGGLKVEVKAPEACDWSLEGLSHYSAVVLENVPAEKIGLRGMETIAAWVQL